MHLERNIKWFQNAWQKRLRKPENIKYIDKKMA
jgi:hypothetical protein